jgi:hypothetical protein
MSIDLSGVRLKIERAEKHFADLNSAISAFLERKPFYVVIDKETNPTCEIYRFAEHQAIPVEWSAIVGDCIHNLRSALDHLAVALVKDGGGTPGDYTAFPIGSDRTHFETSAIKRLDGASARSIEIVRSINPYRGGNDAIWRLHRLDIADKHSTLVPVAAAQNMWGFQLDIREPGREHYPRIPSRMLRGVPLERRFPLKHGDELGAYSRQSGPNVEDNTKFDFGFEVAFGEGQIFDGEAVIPTLNDLIQFTKSIVRIFDRD